MRKRLTSACTKKFGGDLKVLYESSLGPKWLLNWSKSKHNISSEKSCTNFGPFWNPHFRSEIWCLTAWSAGKALVQKILVWSWKYCNQASIRRFYFFNRPNSGREKCNSIFGLPKVTKNDKFCTKKVVVKLPCMICVLTFLIGLFFLNLSIIL